MKRRRAAPAGEPSLVQFTRTAQAASGAVIGAYSTSFGVATRLLGRRHRGHVRSIYALVRVADEIVDGVAGQAGLSPQEQRAALDRYEAETHLAMRTGYSSDLVIHAFAQTARESGIDESLTRPFFASMRSDLGAGTGDPLVLDETAHAAYVHGSAEVIGLMCLRVFIRDENLDDAQRARLEHGARQLGAAFQNINFLRDVGDDTRRLHRGYLGTDGPLTLDAVARWIVVIRGQLADADAVIPLLPHDARAAVRSARALFAALTDRLERTPAAQLGHVRVRVPDPVKIALASAAVLTTLREGRG